MLYLYSNKSEGEDGLVGLVLKQYLILTKNSHTKNSYHLKIWYGEIFVEIKNEFSLHKICLNPYFFYFDNS